MSCNGCRVLRKGCSENCILRPSIQWIDTPESQGHATLFVAKFFGRAGLISFLSGVPENQRPALFQSLLFEACGRTVNPVNGAVGLLWTGNWNVCQAAVQTVLRGGTLRPISDFVPPPDLDDASEAEAAFTNMFKSQRDPNSSFRSRAAGTKRRRGCESPNEQLMGDLGLSLTPCSGNFYGIGGDRRPGTPSRNSEESVTTVCFDSSSGGDGGGCGGRGAGKLLDLFN